jgi:hypothetical protein
MSLFVCEECGCIENTALSRFWLRKTSLGKGTEGRALCSACDPETEKWHGRFPQRQYDPERDHPNYMDGEWIEASS